MSPLLLVSLIASAPAEVPIDWLRVEGFETPTATVLRINDLRLRDPHVFAQIFPGSFGCIDITDTGTTSVNGQINAALNQDTNPQDGFIDSSSLLIFKPLDRVAGIRVLEQVSAQCTMPVVGTSCTDGGNPVTRGNYLFVSAGDSCAAPIAGTTGGYSPAVPTINPACFVTGSDTDPTGGAGLGITLSGTRIAGNFAALPSHQINSGLIRGFLTEAQAQQIILPATLPAPLGGATLASLLPGGPGNCSVRNDVDLVAGVRGWWFYFGYTANEVTYTSAMQKKD
jgi:hypothetical protein